MDTMTPVAPTPDFAAIKARQHAAWASGDYAVIGTTLQIVGESLAEAWTCRRAQVLDVAAGNGNATLAAARRWLRGDLDRLRRRRCSSAAARRAEAEGLDVAFAEADAEALPFADGSFDAVLSTFGVMFAPEPGARRRAELLRVCRPGGRIGLANWTPEGFIGQLFKHARQARAAAGRRQVAGALGQPRPWIEELFGGSARGHRRARRAASSSATARPAHFIDVFRTWYGPVHKAFVALDAGRAGGAGRRPARADRAVRHGDRRDDAGALGVQRGRHHPGVTARRPGHARRRVTG